MVAAGWSNADLAAFGDVIEDIAATDEHRALDHLHHFKQRCEKYGSPDDMSSYLIETAHSHPSWDTAVPYFDRDANGVVKHLHNSPPVDANRNDAAFCAIHLWQALVAVHLMLETSPLEPALEDARKRMQRLAPGGA